MVPPGKRPDIGDANGVFGIGLVFSYVQIVPILIHSVSTRLECASSAYRTYDHTPMTVSPNLRARAVQQGCTGRAGTGCHTARKRAVLFARKDLHELARVPTVFQNVMFNTFLSYSASTFPPHRMLKRPVWPVWLLPEPTGTTNSDLS